MNILHNSKAALAALVLFTAGCGPVFMNPPPPMSHADRHIVGQWLSKDKDGEFRLGIYPHSNSCVEVVATLWESAAEGSLLVQVFTGYTTEAGNHRYLCLTPQTENTNAVAGEYLLPESGAPDSRPRPKKTNEVPAGYQLFRYKAGRRTLDVSPLSASYFYKLVTNGTLHGQTKRSLFFLDLTITSPAKDVTAALSHAPPDMLEKPDEPVRFRRVD